MKGIYGLGNPGNKYQETRHNAGAMLVNNLSKQWNIRLISPRSFLQHGIGHVQGQEVSLFLSDDYMNHSGNGYEKILQEQSFDSPDDLLIAYDDLDLEPGTIRMRPGGSAGGHKGMQSVIDAAGTHEIPRLRLGIGAPHPQRPTSDYVLSTFPNDEQDLVQQMFQQAEEGLRIWLESGIQKAMNQVNG